MNWSPQQTAFLDWCASGSGSVVLEAVAGAGKTTVLLEGVTRLSGQVAIMAFNKKIADEIKFKLERNGITFKKAQAGTVHSFGFGAWRKFREKGPKLRVEDYKVNKLLDDMMPDTHHLVVFKNSVARLISLAKQKALGVIGDIENANEWFAIADHYDVFDDADGVPPVAELVTIAQKCLHKSNAIFDVIDFDDMIYLPLYHQVKFWQFDVVMIDEAQDTNAARRAMVRAMLKKGGRVIAVGDRHQAIYGFTGADADSLDLIAKDFSCAKLPLTITYRCPKKVVAFAQKWVSHITAASSASEGVLSKVTMENFLKRNDLTSGSAVLSRVTKPLVALAFTLIRKRIACRIEGRDIGKRITKLMTRWKITCLDELEAHLDTYLSNETTKLLSKNQEAKLTEVEDAVETVKTIMDQCRKENKHEISDAVDYVESIFGDNVSNVMVLSTIHKAKGREWPRVFWLDRPGTCPSKWARKQWQLDQEDNLCYVAATRAQEELIELQGKAA